MTSDFRRISDHLLNLGVLALAVLPLLLFSGKPWTNAIENRHSARAPGWPQSMQAWRHFPAAFEAWFNDSFGLRQPMIDARNNIDYWVFGKSPTTLVMRGRKEWLFYIGDNSTGDYVGRPVLTDNELAEWSTALRARHDWLASRGIPYYFVVVPNKQSVYPEYMPPAMYHGKMHMLDRLLAAMSTPRPPPWIIDLRPALLSAKGGKVMFHLLDVHWNDYGAYVGYRALADILRRDGIPVAELGLEPGQFVETHDDPGHDLADVMGMKADLQRITTVRFGGPALPCGVTAPAAAVPGLRFTPWMHTDLQTNCPQSGNATSALIFHDSMMIALRRYLSASLGHARFVWTYPAIDDLQRYVEADHPTIVIEERVERELIKPPAPPPAGR